jgi:hypothetical protein
VPYSAGCERVEEAPYGTRPDELVTRRYEFVGFRGLPLVERFWKPSSSRVTERAGPAVCHGFCPLRGQPHARSSRRAYAELPPDLSLGPIGTSRLRWSRKSSTSVAAATSRGSGRVPRARFLRR